ncbi:mucin-5AC-like [Sycon ciliatum]|uniref:mucin-5AC-like n=1 Tax=Sycon ciliatum TaxID=27933 RepID=UPI0031F6470E
MIARVLHGTSALLIAISLFGSGSLGAILRNCQPEDGKIHVHGDTVYVQPANDTFTTRNVGAEGKLYKKPFIFTSPCDVSFKAISLLYFGACSVSVSYGSDNRVLEILQFPDPPTDTWHRRNVSLTNTASQSLHGFMKRNNTRRFLITISKGRSNCQLVGVDHNKGRGLVIIGQVIPTSISARPVTNTAIATNQASTHSTQKTVSSTVPTSIMTTPSVDSSRTEGIAPSTAEAILLVESTSGTGTSIPRTKLSASTTRNIEQLDSDSVGFNLVTSIVIPLVLLAVLLGVFILMLLVRSGTFLSKSSHPWIIAVRRSTSPKNMPDPINQFYQNRDGTNSVDQSPTAELTDPGLYSAVGPGYRNPNKRPQTPPGIPAARYDIVTENESYTFATCNGAAPTSYVNTETKQKDAGEPYASVQSMFDQPTQEVQSNPANNETQAARCEKCSAPTVSYAVPHKRNSTDVCRHYEKAEECTASKRDEAPSTANSIEHICRATDVTSLSVLSKSAKSAVHNQDKSINPDDVERKQRRGLSDATTVVCRDNTTTTTSTYPPSSRLSLLATNTSTPARSDSQRCVSPSPVPKPLPYRVFKVLKDSQGDYMNPQDTVSSQGADQADTDTDPNIYAEPAISLSDDGLYNASTIGKRDDVGGISSVPVDLPDLSAIYAVPQKNCET